KLPVEREPTPEERRVRDKVPSRPLPPHPPARLPALARRAGVPPEKVAALQELAAASHGHPLLLRGAASGLKGPDTWEAVLTRLHGLRGADLQEKIEDMIGQMCEELARRKPEALTLMQALRTFSGGATLEALRYVWCGGRVSPDSDEAARFDD